MSNTDPVACRELWLAVLALALQDIRRGGKKANVARGWMAVGGAMEDDFVAVCDLAGVDPGWVRRIAVRGKKATPR